MDCVVKGNAIVILIQARVFSSRLRAKVLQKFFGETIIDRIIRISKNITNKKNIYILSGSKRKNLIFNYYAKKHGIKIFFGNDNNVLERFKKCIKKYNLENKCILRITSDNYLIQPKIIKSMIKNFFIKQVDYAFIRPLSHFSGEIFKAKVLFSINPKNKKNRGHVTYEIRKNNNFNVLSLNDNFCSINHKKFFTLDNLMDLSDMQKIQHLFPALKRLDCINTIRTIQKKWKFV